MGPQGHLKEDSRSYEQATESPVPEEIGVSSLPPPCVRRAKFDLGSWLSCPGSDAYVNLISSLIKNVFPPVFWFVWVFIDAV